MANLNELSLAIRLFVRTYPWRRVDPVPWVTPRKPLAESRLALVTSAGLVSPGQPAFEAGVRGGDASFRILPDDADLRAMRESHRSGSFDHGGIREDPNLAFPLDRVHELVAEGRLGESAPRHVSLMGSVSAPGRLVKTTAPEIARLLTEDRVDVALLVPV